MHPLWAKTQFFNPVNGKKISKESIFDRLKEYVRRDLSECIKSLMSSKPDPKLRWLTERPALFSDFKVCTLHLLRVHLIRPQAAILRVFADDSPKTLREQELTDGAIPVQIVLEGILKSFGIFEYDADEDFGPDGYKTVYKRKLDVIFTAYALHHLICFTSLHMFYFT